MSDRNTPLEDRPGYFEDNPKKHALARELGQLAKRHDLRGAVLISFTRDDRVGVNSSGEPEMFARAMDQLASRILTAIDNGDFDPTVHLQ